MDVFKNIKKTMDYNEEIEYLCDKLNFGEINVFKYIGFNQYNIDYSATYLVDGNNNKKQLNLLLLRQGDCIEEILCIQDYIVVKKKGETPVIYLKDNNILSTFFKNVFDIIRMDSLLTNLTAYKNYDLYNLLRCKKRYNYFHETPTRE